MVVQHNLTAMNANRYLGINNNKLSKSLEKLSSGYSINRAGDNAAGLAVSEKMRSQIAGMTQAVKNAQDGISMVQTFEGALTETDSILQRMKTLADQMANGTYDDPVDRVAAQQEFLQLQDELDQIADTDFNGVVVLNGGVMADGTCAEGVEATFNAAGHVESKTVADDYKGGLIDYTKEADDSSSSAAAGGLGTANLDDGAWNGAAANTLWDDLGITTKDATELEITFEYQGDGTWKAIAADCDKVTQDKLDALNITPTDNGGFQITNADGSVNVVVDTINAVKGDTVSVKFTNNQQKAEEPTNIGFSDRTGIGDTITGDPADATTGFTPWSEEEAKAISIDFADATFDFEDADIQKLIDALNGATLEFTIEGQNNALAAAANDTITLTLKDSDGNPIQGVTVTNNNDGTFSITADKDGSVIATVRGVVASNHQTLGAQDSSAMSSTFELTINIAGYTIPDDSAGVDAEIGEVGTGGAGGKDNSYAVSKSDAFGQSRTKMTYTNNITLQVGARTKDAVNFTFKYDTSAIGNLTADLDCTAYGLGINLLNLNTQEAANDAIDKIDQAINKVNLVRGTFGAIQNRLEHKIDNLNVSVENLTSAESQIRDTDMPTEMMNFTKNQILAQASQSMLAQANQLPQSVLQLLQ